ncbi:acyltransferase domain-containing protein [Kitasatospora sp. NPDC086791]|uniref:acyltransferase domain-containing protein n=1 Tax=Kitasatospora sp. NPDC086791 TaxID=3155178 RepID=UPI003416E1F4
METTAPSGPRPVVLMFAGQGAQHPGMGRHLYGTEPVFTAALEEVFGLLGPRARRLRADFLAGRADGLDDAERAQPLLFALGYATARLVRGWGVRPAALLGHSVGEAVAAVVAGVMSLPDAVRLLVARTEAAARTPPGGMLAVAAPAGALAPLLPAGVVIGAVNGPRQTLLAGADAPLAEAERRLRGRGVLCRRARARQGFHSPLMDPVVASTLPDLARTPLRPPAVRLYSACTGHPLTPAQAVDPRFWAGQIAAPVLFGPALDRLLADGDVLLVDAGPGESLLSLARRHPAVTSGRSDVVAVLPPARADTGLVHAALPAALRRIRAEGHRSCVQ